MPSNPTHLNKLARTLMSMDGSLTYAQARIKVLKTEPKPNYRSDASITEFLNRCLTVNAKAPSDFEKCAGCSQLIHQIEFGSIKIYVDSTNDDFCPNPTNKDGNHYPKAPSASLEAQLFSTLTGNELEPEPKSPGKMTIDELDKELAFANGFLDPADDSTYAWLSKLATEKAKRIASAPKGPTKIYARVTAQGTAAFESAVCEAHKEVDLPVDFDVLPGLVDCSENDSLYCQVCGAVN